MTSIPEHALQEALSVLMKHARSSSNLRAVKQESSQSYLAEQLDEEAYQMDKVLSQFNLHVRGQITLRRQHQNSSTAIHRLPAELLGIVFLLILQDTDPRSISLMLKDLASVSSIWFAVILSTPSLWCHLSSTSDLAFIKHAISRSGQVMLHIHIYDVSLHDNIERQYWEVPCNHVTVAEIKEREFIKLLIPHIARWRTFRSISQFTAVLLSDLLTTGSTPHLESFEVVPKGHMQRRAEVPYPIQTTAVRLKILAIPTHSFPLGSQMFSQLESITFTPYIRDRPFTTHDWHACLSMAANTSNLHIDVANRESLAACQIQGAFMPRARMIKLDYPSPQLSGALLSSILVAPDQRLSILITCSFDDYEPQYAENFQNIFPHSSPRNSLLSLVRLGAHLEIRWKDQTSFVKWTGDDVEFELRVTTRNTAAIPKLSTLIPNSSRSNIKVMVLDGEELFAADVLSYIWLFTGLEQLILHHIGIELSIGQTDTRLEDICEALAPPYSYDSSGAEVWPCPKLRYLEIGDLNDLAPVWDLVQRRYGGSIGGASGLPVLLEELHLIQSKTPCFSIDPVLIAQLEEFLTVRNIELKYEEASDSDQGYKRVARPMRRFANGIQLLA